MQEFISSSSRGLIILAEVLRNRGLKRLLLCWSIRKNIIEMQMVQFFIVLLTCMGSYDIIQQEKLSAAAAAAAY